MNLINRLNVIKTIFIFIAIFVCSISSTYSAKIAQVIIPKAIIYADENLTAPIGHVSNGKLIPVGSPLINNPDIVPVIITGRLAFVHIQDIKFVSKEDEELEKRKGAPKEHNIDYQFVTTEDRLSENNHVSFAYGTQMMGQSLENFFLAVDGSDKKFMHRFYIDFLHRSPEKRFAWGIGAEILNASSTYANVTSLLFSPQVSYALIKINQINLEIYGALNIGAGNTLRIDNNFTNEPQGWFGGWEIGARAFIPLNSRWSAFGSFGTKYLKAYDIKELEYESGEIGEISALQGVNFLLGLSFSLN